MTEPKLRRFNSLVAPFVAMAILALIMPNLAEATPIMQSDMPGAQYTNFVNGGIINDAGSSQGHATGAPSSGLSVSGGPPLFSSSTSNDYAIPRVSASALANAGATASAQSALSYFVAFSGADGSVPVSVQARTILQLTLQEVQTGVNAYFQTLDITGGTQLLSLNQSFMLQANALYRVIMNTQAISQGSGGAGNAFLDPFFSAPGGYAVLTSAGIGNASPVATTPIPAALPLFASALAALGLLRRRKQEAAARAV